MAVRDDRGEVKQITTGFFICRKQIPVPPHGYQSLGINRVYGYMDYINLYLDSISLSIAFAGSQPKECGSSPITKNLMED